MKKLMIFALVAACAVQLQAVTYTHYQKTLPTGWTGGDTYTEDDFPYFNVYGMSGSQLSQLTGLTFTSGSMGNTLNTARPVALAAAQSLTSWIKNNFAKAENAFSQNGVSINDNKSLYTGTLRYGENSSSGTFLTSTYTTTESYADSWQDLQYIVDFYTGDNVGEDNVAFRVGVIGKGTLPDSNDIQGISGHVVWDSWTVVEYIDPIPEPTSGMLLLLGVAGLMLKRKRA